MRPPLFVRPLTQPERSRLEAGLRSPDAFVLRRCQILLASARGERPARVAQAVGCDDQTVRTVIGIFEQSGIDVCLTRRSTRPHRPKSKLDAAATERLGELLHESPRRFGKATDIWTLKLAAQVSFEQGITKERVSHETVRLALRRLGKSWRRAKHWITSPDPEYGRKKGRVIA
jgi:transposase